MKCALILLPGLDPVQQDHYRDVLVRNLVAAEVSVSILERGDAGVPDERAACLRVEDGSEKGITVHVYEAWWGDLVAEMSAPVERQLQLITLGSPARVLAYRSRWLRRTLERACGTPVIAEWHDYYSEQDWMCTSMFDTEQDWMCTSMFDTEQHDSSCQSHRLERDAPLTDRLTGVTHKAYFRDRAVLRGVLASLSNQEAPSP